MKNVYKIYPVYTSKLRLDKGHFTYRKYYGEKILFPVFAWLIKGDGETILIDTGCSAEEMMRYSATQKEMGGEDGPPIEDTLQKMGISMSDIKTIVVTHLHLDHFLNAKKFPNAELIIQEEELRFAMNPHPLFSPQYNKEWYKGLRFKTVSGDTEIIPGVEVIFTPGHAPGCQSVSVSTVQGKAVIIGFCSIDENFTKEGDIVPGLHTDPLKAYDSIVKIRKIADILLPCHSGRFLGAASIP
jgi:glyoxylase-like metal-dependent hydrolase (beta-lactamase superfamily II)